MSDERIQCIVTYDGDVTKQLIECKSQCPMRLNKDGNTEQRVDVARGKLFTGVPDDMMFEAIEPVILSECAKNGNVINVRWIRRE